MPTGQRRFFLLPRSTPRIPGGLAFPFLAAALLLAGCVRSGPPADLVIINGAEPESLDPGLLTGQADGRVALELFEGLTRYDPTNAAPIPGLAESWDISPDGRVYTFHLRPNAVWSSGEPITARDFVYSWLRVLNPGTASEYAGVLFYLKNGEEYCSGNIRDASQVGVKAMDDHTLRVGALVLDVARREATIGARSAHLSDREFRVLHHLVEHAGEVISRERLLSEVWGYHFDPGSNVVEVCVRRLRKKLGEEAPIETVRHAGYRLRAA